MKNIFIIVCLTFIFASCSDELNLTPVSSKTEANFYKTPEHIELAINGCYDALQQALVTNLNSFRFSEARSDNTWQGTEYDDGAFTRFSEDPSTPSLASCWNNKYQFIYRCNKVLEAIPNIDANEIDKKKWEGEARFIRAILYFELVRIFGEVPIVTTPLGIAEAYEVPKSSIEEVYDLIRDDLEAIVGNQLLSREIVPGRASLYSAMALLGKVYIYRSGYPLMKSEWTKAADMLGQVINSGEFEFMENYADIFAHKNENGRQSVFSIKFSNGISEGNTFPTRNAPNEIDPADFIYGGSPFRLFIKQEFVEQIFPEEGDLRKDVSLRTSWLNKTGVTVTHDPWCRKYAEYNDDPNGPVSSGNDWDIDWIVIRYTDVLMLYAEALNELEGPNGEALEILNMVRSRAGLSNRTATDAATFRLWMEQERRSEFCFENQRWFDLVRTDRALEVMQNFLQEQGGGFENNFTSRDKYYFPVPQIVTDLTGIQ